MIREETMETVRAYIFERVPPGSYLLAVLSNDLMGAFKGEGGGDDADD